MGELLLAIAFFFTVVNILYTLGSMIIIGITVGNIIALAFLVFLIGALILSGAILKEIFDDEIE